MIDKPAEIMKSYEDLYFAYNALNRVGWGGVLPPVTLHVSNKLNGRVLGYASPYGKGEFRIPLITLTHRMKNALDEECLALLAHEMTHIWQFATHRPLGHAKEFYKELQRIGIDEKNHFTQLDSPYGFVMRLIHMRGDPLHRSIGVLSNAKITIKKSFSYFNYYKTN